MRTSPNVKNLMKKVLELTEQLNCERADTADLKMLLGRLLSDGHGAMHWMARAYVAEKQLMDFGLELQEKAEK